MKDLKIVKIVKKSRNVKFIITQVALECYRELICHKLDLNIIKKGGKETWKYGVKIYQKHNCY